MSKVQWTLDGYMWFELKSSYLMSEEGSLTVFKEVDGKSKNCGVFHLVDGIIGYNIINNDKMTNG